MNADVAAGGFVTRISGDTDTVERGLLEFAADVATDEDRPAAVHRLHVFNLEQRAGGLRRRAARLPRLSWRRLCALADARAIERELRRIR